MHSFIHSYKNKTFQQNNCYLFIYFQNTPPSVTWPSEFRFKLLRKQNGRAEQIFFATPLALNSGFKIKPKCAVESTRLLRWCLVYRQSVIRNTNKPGLIYWTFCIPVFFIAAVLSSTWVIPIYYTKQNKPVFYNGHETRFVFRTF